MSILSLKRAILVIAVTLLGTAVHASHPSPRAYSAMAFDESTSTGVLFGGRGLEDPATGLIHATDETWFWVSNQWVQRMPAHHPPARSAHAMVYDAQRARVLLFGGRKESTDALGTWTHFNDLWQFKNGDWQQVETATAPPAREFAGLAYDADRDRVIMFGGYNYKADGKTSQAVFDTWEFDGSNWTEVQNVGPSVNKPLLVFDAARHETLLLGIDATAKTLMYRWDVPSKTWKSITPTTLPTCVNEGGAAYQAHNQRVIVTGGVCSTTTPLIDETWEWDGGNWTKLETTATSRFIGAAITYDVKAERLVRYGGLAAFAERPDSSTYVYRDLRWSYTSPTANPVPRSLPVFRRDPVRNHIWLMGGLSEFSGGTDIFYVDDLWRFENGEWYTEPRYFTSFPSQCETPLSTFDTDRGVMVVVCGDGRVTEWDGTTWKAFDSLDDQPDPRRFAGLAYDETLKKTVYFGGWDGVNFRDDTWTWNGTAWTEVKTKTEPENRSQMAFWYDPLAKKVMLFSGAGRPNLDARVTRYSDMWSFDGTNWTKMSVTATPGIRFGSQLAVDPRTGKVLLFGGLRAVVEGKNVDQFYDNDLWIWDGAASNWTKVATSDGPGPRQNGGFEFDPTLGKFVLFGGFMGNIYLSDVWTLDGDQWTALPDRVQTRHRRAVRP
jgi:N-acetylneuraminic acid mutarotase